MDNRPIGVYDSGFGGLTILRAVRERLPDESFIYLGDGKNCPYGGRAKEEIRGFAFAAVERLLAEGCKMIVVACNTATAAAIEQLRAEYPEVDFVGVEPAVKPACLATKSGIVGVLATQSSIDGDMFHRTAAKYSAGIRVIAHSGDGFVEIVEQSLEESPEAEEAVRKVVMPMVEEGVDQIVLGCTHYPFLLPLLRRIAPKVNIIDPSPAVAKRVEELLESSGTRAESGDTMVESGARPSCKFITFADEEYRNRLCCKLGVRSEE